MVESVRLKSFDLIAKDINKVDVDALHALTVSVRWPHRPKDWELLLRAGHGVVAIDDIGRVFGSAMWFPQGDRFSTIGLVITTPRVQAQGGGRWLMERVLEHCGDHNLLLNATRAAYPMYLSLGFTSEGVVHMHQGEISASAPPVPDSDGVLYQLDRDKIGEISELDKNSFGSDRIKILTLLSENASIYVLRYGNNILGYSMCREFGRGYVIGPILARNDSDAIHLTSIHMQSLRGQFVRVDTRERDGAFVNFLEQSGLHIDETVITMSRGFRMPAHKASEPRVFGLAGHALS